MFVSIVCCLFCRLGWVGCLFVIFVVVFEVLLGNVCGCLNCLLVSLFGV